ncbi:TDP1, partial [Symbiodinium sp. CCMP2592]
AALREQPRREPPGISRRGPQDWPPGDPRHERCSLHADVSGPVHRHGLRLFQPDDELLRGELAERLPDRCQGVPSGLAAFHSGQRAGSQDPGRGNDYSGRPGDDDQGARQCPGRRPGS